MKLISLMLKELKKLQLPETIFLRRDLDCLWRVTPITSLMKKLFRIERGTTGRCLVPFGADLSQGDDFCAFTFLFPLPNGSFGIKTRNYITSTTLMKLPAAMRIKYDQFMAEGSLIVLEGAVLNMMDVYEDLDNHIQECGYDVRCLGFDPYNAKRICGEMGI